MPNAKTIRLTAYEVSTQEVVFDYLSYLISLHPIAAGQVMESGKTKWKIVGIRTDSGPETMRIDVTEVL